MQGVRSFQSASQKTRMSMLARILAVERGGSLMNGAKLWVLVARAGCPSTAPVIRPPRESPHHMLYAPSPFMSRSSQYTTPMYGIRNPTSMSRVAKTPRPAPTMSESPTSTHSAIRARNLRCQDPSFGTKRTGADFHSPRLSACTHDDLSGSGSGSLETVPGARPKRMSSEMSLFMSALFFALSILTTFVLLQRAESRGRSLTVFGKGAQPASENDHNNLLGDKHTGFVEDVMLDTSRPHGYLVVVDSPEVAEHTNVLLYHLSGPIEVADFTGNVKMPQNRDGLLHRLKFLPVQGYLGSDTHPKWDRAQRPARVPYDSALAVALYTSSFERATVIRGDTLVLDEGAMVSAYPDVGGAHDLSLFTVNRGQYRGHILMALHRALHDLSRRGMLDFLHRRRAAGEYPSFIELPTGYLLECRVYTSHITNLALAEDDLWAHLRHVLVASDVVPGPLGPERVGESQQLRPMENDVRQMLHAHIKVVQTNRNRG